MIRSISTTRSCPKKGGIAPGSVELGRIERPAWNSRTGVFVGRVFVEVKWNFTKFLVDQEGRVVGRFESSVEPLDGRVTSAIDALLEENPS